MVICNNHRVSEMFSSLAPGVYLCDRCGGLACVQGDVIRCGECGYPMPVVRVKEEKVREVIEVRRHVDS